ncbi:MAG: ZIP family metal transporter [Deltaproteobacteria bacterium]|nr:ZIP family metal transporter [Deltaproteobacteria bacterium]MBW2360024.1 ZIP family metal transporter [Deltaproteobacteria bacterium]
MFEIKFLLLLAVLAAGAVGGAIPLWRGGAGQGRFLGLGNAMAAGVFLGTAWIHMLPDAAEAWGQLGWRYPMAYLLAAFGFILMLLFEHVLLPDSAHEVVHAPSNERFAHLREHGRGAFTAYAVLVALSVHSLLAGLALGAQPDLAGALVIFLAIMAHKSIGGFALGVSLVRNRMPMRRAWSLLALFAVATPLGILVGAGVGETLEGRGRVVFEAAFLALAAGSFAYVATLDILRDEFLEPGGRWSKWLLVLLGTGLMGAIARWV